MKKNDKKKFDVNGILIFDKPAGCSSNFALQRVKRLFNAKKAGHTGSLDPIATGVLPICFGKATKLAEQLMMQSKIYRVKIKLGIQTTTGDLEGEMTQESPVNEALTENDLQNTLNSFVGEIEQIPPMYSALKHNGVRLYELARKGIEIERKPRKIHIYRFDLISKLANNQLELSVHCSKGTYVRTLIEDFAKQINTCAHVLELRRVATGSFSEEQAIAFEQLEAIEQAHGAMHLYKLLKTAEQIKGLI